MRQSTWEANMIIALFAIAIVVDGKISIDVEAGKDLSNIEINYSGFDKDVISDKEVELFNLNELNLKRAVRNKYGVTPRDVYLKSPTPWGDLYKTYNWEEVTRVLKVKSAETKETSVKSMLVLSQDFDNPSNLTIKVNAGISQSVENTISTAWSMSKESTIAQEIEYDLNVVFAKISGTTSFSYTSTWGKSVEKTEAVTIGTTSSVEAELKPGQSATAVLSANRRVLEIEVVYVINLQGIVAVNFRKKHNGHHFYGPSIGSVLKSGGLANEMLVVEKIAVGVYTDASLKVFDKDTGLPL